MAVKPVPRLISSGFVEIPLDASPGFKIGDLIVVDPGGECHSVYQLVVTATSPDGAQRRAVHEITVRHT